MIRLKEQPLALADIKNKKDFPLIYPRDSKSYALFIQHGDLAEMIRTEIRALAWHIESEEFNVHENKHDVCGVFTVSIPGVVLTEGWSFCVGFTSSYSRRHRLTLYLGAVDNNLKLGFTTSMFKAPRMIFGRDFSKEVRTILEEKIVKDAALIPKVIDSLENSALEYELLDYGKLLVKSDLIANADAFYELLEHYGSEKTKMGFLLGYCATIKTRPNFSKMKWQLDVFSLINN